MSEVEELSIPATTARADEIVQADQLAARLEAELARLPEPQRVAFELVSRRGLSLSHAAETLKITIGALKLRLHRAQSSLRSVVATTNGAL